MPGGLLTSRPTRSSTLGCLTASAFFVSCREEGSLRLRPKISKESERNMKTTTEPTEAGRDYDVAYAAHYTDHDLSTALQFYLKVVASHPGTKEAGYARSQAQNIINATVPDQELLEAQVKLAVAHFERQGPPDTTRIPDNPLVLKPST